MTKKGFTIVELVMVVAVLGILLGIVMTVATGSIREARRRKADACCRIVQAGFETYYAQKGEWPGNMGDKIDGMLKSEDADTCVIEEAVVRDMMIDILKEYKKGNPCLDISGLFVSRYDGGRGTKHRGMDFMTAIQGTKEDENKQAMTMSEMHFGYPEEQHGYFRSFKVVYSLPADKITVSRQ